MSEIVDPLDACGQIDIDLENNVQSRWPNPKSSPKCAGYWTNRWVYLFFISRERGWAKGGQTGGSRPIPSPLPPILGREKVNNAPPRKAGFTNFRLSVCSTMARKKRLGTQTVLLIMYEYVAVICLKVMELCPFSLKV